MGNHLEVHPELAPPIISAVDLVDALDLDADFLAMTTERVVFFLERFENDMR